jgi:predicted nucleic acid-binding protein
MAYLVDTNVMWRRFEPSDSHHSIIKAALDALLRRGEVICVTAQNLIEFQAVATRPLELNSLGLTTIEASQKAEEIEAVFSFLPDTPDIYPKWRTLVDTHDVKGKQVHDARLVAVMRAHGISHFLTMNPTHFQRFTEITVVEPQNVNSL